MPKGLLYRALCNYSLYQEALRECFQRPDILRLDCEKVVSDIEAPLRTVGRTVGGVARW